MNYFIEAAIRYIDMRMILCINWRAQFACDKLARSICMLCLSLQDKMEALTQVDNDYCLVCPICQDRGGDGICVDGIWFFDNVNVADHNPEAGLYCCTNCINWCKKHTRKWFKDDVKRKWYRYTRSDVCRWEEVDWDESKKRTKDFVQDITKQEAEKTVSKRNSGTVGSPGASSLVIVRGRKRKCRTVDMDNSVTDTTVFTRERYNPKSTFAAFDNAVKTLHEFLKLCHNTKSISESGHNIITMQVKVLEDLVNTLKEHMS